MQEKYGLSQDALRNQINAKRVSELESLVNEFIAVIETDDVQSLWMDRHIDLLYTYEKACYALGKMPEQWFDLNGNDDDEETGYEEIWVNDEQNNDEGE